MLPLQLIFIHHNILLGSAYHAWSTVHDLQTSCEVTECRQTGEDWTTTDPVTSCDEAAAIAGEDDEMMSCISGLVSLPESPGSLMYDADGEPKGAWSPVLYWTMALYTNGIKPSIATPKFEIVWAWGNVSLLDLKRKLERVVWGVRIYKGWRRHRHIQGCQRVPVTYLTL